MRSKWIGRALEAAVALSVVMPVSPVEASRKAEEHCVVEVLGEAADGTFVTAEPVCFSSFVGAADHLGVRAQSSSEARRGVVALSSTIGVHYDGFNYTGSSITVTGSDCAGGYLNLSIDWRNRISSTINGCPVVRFYDFINLGGTSETTTYNRNLTTMNNDADSIQYSSS